MKINFVLFFETSHIQDKQQNWHSLSVILSTEKGRTQLGMWQFFHSFFCPSAAEWHLCAVSLKQQRCWWSIHWVIPQDQDQYPSLGICYCVSTQTHHLANTPFKNCLDRSKVWEWKAKVLKPHHLHLSVTNSGTLSKSFIPLYLIFLIWKIGAVIISPQWLLWDLNEPVNGEWLRQSSEA